MKQAFSRLAALMLGGVLWAAGCGGEPAGPLTMPPAVGRPEGTSQGPRVAVIVAARGGVTIVPRTGANFTGGPHRQLLRDDTIVVAADSFVVVELYNRHLVRLKPNERYVVEMLAGFHDPPAGDDLEARFMGMLEPAERDDEALRGAIGRVAGWNTRKTAAETIAPLPLPPRDADELAGGDIPTAPPARSNAGDEPESPAVGGSGEFGRGKPADPLGRDDGAPVADARAGEPSKRPETESSPEPDTSRPRAESKKASDAQPDAEAGPALDLEDRVTFTPAGGGTPLKLSLPQVLRPGRAALASCAGAGATIVAQVKDRKLVALTVGGDPRCQKGLLGKKVGLADGSFELRVTP